MKTPLKSPEERVLFACALLARFLLSCSTPIASVDAANAVAQPAGPGTEAAQGENAEARGAKSDLEITLAPHESGAEWSHPPFEDGECSACHERDDPNSPGKITGEVNELCFECHDDLQEAVTNRKHPHEAAVESCTNCHNPHNAMYSKQLVAAVPRLCFECHDEIADAAKNSRVDHSVVLNGRACLSCHDPHGSDVARLLLQPPYGLCLDCHDEDNMKDSNGNVMTNMKKHLADNPEHHAPVADEDCTTCHRPHGSEYFRLLVRPYPEQFYSPYSPERYALCFECHDEEMLASPKTSSDTGFRDGTVNLHYKHVNKAGRGRTCRACHDVHASKKPHQIREGVPFGPGGWQLSTHYEASETGGRCSRTCHTTKVYENNE